MARMVANWLMATPHSNASHWAQCFQNDCNAFQDITLPSDCPERLTLVSTKTVDQRVRAAPTERGISGNMTTLVSCQLSGLMADLPDSKEATLFGLSTASVTKRRNRCVITEGMSRWGRAARHGKKGQGCRA